MKTDKKKLMRKLIAIGLMAAMLTANTMTYGSNLMLPSVTAEALSISEEGATVIDISEKPADGGIYVYINESGTYILKGSNYREDGDSYVKTKIIVSGEIEANIILDGVEIRNSTFQLSGAEDFNAHHPFEVGYDCTVNIYIKSDSVLTCSVDGEQGCIEGFDNSTINFMESENNAKLTTEIIYAPNVNFKGANVVGQPKETSTAVTMTDGYCGYANEAAVLGSDDVITGGYCTLNASSNPTDGNGNNVYRSTLSDLPANAKVVSYNGKTYNYSYTDADGQFITYLPDLSASGLVVFFENEVCLYKTENITSAETDGITSYDFSNPTKLSSAINLNKVYDGDGDFNIVGDETIVDEITNLTINSVTPVEANVGTYTTTANIGFTYGGQNYTTDIEVPVEITAKELTATITAKNKVYDFSAKADVEVTFEGLANSDTLTKGVDYNITAEFADENVGTGKTVTATITLADNVANYTLANDGVATTTANITAAPLTITGATIENKTYDGEKTANVKEVMLGGVIDGDVVDYTATAEFADEKIGTDKAVTVTVKLDDTEKNYTLAKTTYETTADIIAKGETIADVVVESKDFDDKTDAKVTSVTFKNEKGEVIPLEYEATAAFADAAAGKGKEVTVTVTLKDSTYTLTESKFTAKADINIAGETKFVSYESVEDKPSLPKADNFVDKEVNGEGLIVVKSPKTETKDYYFAYLVKSEKFKIGNAEPKTGTFYVALNDKGEKTRKFTVSIPFTTVIIDGKTYKAPDGYAYYAFGITDVPTKYDLHCSENIELN